MKESYKMDYSIDSRMNNRQLISAYNNVLDNLDKNSDTYLISFNAITRRRDELINRKGLHSKKIRLKTNWYGE